jgi:hypothetical protein
MSVAQSHRLWKASLTTSVSPIVEAATVDASACSYESGAIVDFADIAERDELLRPAVAEPHLAKLSERLAHAYSTLERPESAEFILHCRGPNGLRVQTSRTFGDAPEVRTRSILKHIQQVGDNAASMSQWFSGLVSTTANVKGDEAVVWLTHESTDGGELTREGVCQLTWQYSRGEGRWLWLGLVHMPGPGTWYPEAVSSSFDSLDPALAKLHLEQASVKIALAYTDLQKPGNVEFLLECRGPDGLTAKIQRAFDFHPDLAARERDELLASTAGTERQFAAWFGGVINAVADVDDEHATVWLTHRTDGQGSISREGVCQLRWKYMRQQQRWIWYELCHIPGPATMFLESEA